MIRSEEIILQELDKLKCLLEKVYDSPVLSQNDKVDLQLIFKYKISVFEWVLYRRESP